MFSGNKKTTSNRPEDVHCKVLVGVLPPKKWLREHKEVVEGYEPPDEIKERQLNV